MKGRDNEGRRGEMKGGRGEMKGGREERKEGENNFFLTMGTRKKLKINRKINKSQQ